MSGSREELTYFIKGSSPDPYIVQISLSPFSISCTCVAAGHNVPCKHRTIILQGGDPGIIKGDTSKLTSVNEAAEASGVFGLLNDYDSAKSAEKFASSLSDKAFKKYRDARLRLLQGQLKTDKVVVKAMGELDASIEALVPAIEKTKAAQKALGEVYMPSYMEAAR